MSVYSDMFCQYRTAECEDLRKITWTTNDCHLTWHDLCDPVTLWILREFHVVCYRFLLSPGQYSVTIVREDFYFLLVRLWLGGNIDAFISWNDSHIVLLTSLSPKMRGAKIKIKTWNILSVSTLEYFYVPRCESWLKLYFFCLNKIWIKN